VFPGFTTFIKPAYLHLRYFTSWCADRRLGITTTDECVARQLGRDLAQLRGTWRAIPFFGVKRLMRRLDPGPHDALLDLGCGAGRAICVAAQHRFSRIIGVELDAEFCALAERNARALRRCITRPEVVCADATTYRVPDEITVVFLYNPFNGPVLHAALKRVLESFDRVPRRMRIVYANPRDHDLLMSMRRFRNAGRFWISWRPGKEWRRTQAVHFYEIDPT
jgi:predicted RNA methylase